MTREHSDDRSEPTLEEIQRHVDHAGLSPLRLFDPEWLSYCAVNERVASRDRVGRVFLLGTPRTSIVLLVAKG